MAQSLKNQPDIEFDDAEFEEREQRIQNLVEVFAFGVGVIVSVASQVAGIVSGSYVAGLSIVLLLTASIWFPMND